MRSPLEFLPHLAIWCCAATADAQQPTRDRWSPSWVTSLLAPAAWDTTNYPILSNRTIREVVRTSVGGDRLRIRLSNEYGDRPLVIGSAHVALRALNEQGAAGSDRPVRFGGSDSVIIRPGAMIVSDPVQLEVAPTTDVLVSLYLPAPNAIIPSILSERAGCFSPDSM